MCSSYFLTHVLDHRKYDNILNLLMHFKNHITLYVHEYAAHVAWELGENVVSVRDMGIQ